MTMALIAVGTSAALTTAGAYMSSSKAGQGAAGNNILSAGQARINNDILRPAQNQLTAATGSLNRWVQSNKNKQILDAGGDALATHMTNIWRVKDQISNQGLSEQIAMAEQVGSAAASQAFNGVSSGVADMVNMTTALRQDIGQTIANQAGVSLDTDARRTAAQLFSQMVNGMDNNILLDSIDFGVDQAVVQKSGDPMTAALLAGAGALVNSGLGKGMLGGGSTAPQTMSSFGTQLGFSDPGTASFGSGMSVGESVSFFNASSPGLGQL